jgi:hypothetical protein
MIKNCSGFAAWRSKNIFGTDAFITYRQEILRYILPLFTGYLCQILFEPLSQSFMQYMLHSAFPTVKILYNNEEVIITTEYYGKRKGAGVYG